MGKIPVGIQIYTVRNEAAQDFQGTVRKVAEIGYAGIESSLGGMTPKDFRKFLDGLGLKLISRGAGLDEIEKDAAAVADVNRELDCKYIVGPGIPGDQRKDAQGWMDFGKRLNDAGAKLQEHGVTLCYHNHSFEFVKFGEKYGLDLIYESSDPRYVQANLDTYWIQHGKENPAAYIRKMPNRAPILHIKDMGKDGQQFLEIGEGILDWASIWSASEAADVKWYSVEQDTCPRPPLESLKLSFENLKKMGRV